MLTYLCSTCCLSSPIAYLYIIISLFQSERFKYINDTVSDTYSGIVEMSSNGCNETLEICRYLERNFLVTPELELESFLYKHHAYLVCFVCS